MIRLFHRAHNIAHGWRRIKDAGVQALVHALRDEAGQDLIEYGLLAGLIAVVAIGAVRITGVEVGAWWTALSTRLTELFAGIL